ncbi:MAG TPA: LemA family protein [Acidobacteriota bacterium]|jgi:LemA protein|nr:LemA family protein [Acidobacteriota bacterium]HRR56538.1 LemA family protein [Acidobacteriota bacterium]HRV08218.1 LemA family protein [Acidobacteriota bacterium]
MTKKVVLGLLIAIVLVLLVVIVVFVGTYNRLVTMEESVDGAWAQVETVLQRRYDLIPNLVNTVKGFAQQELQVFTEVTRLRSQWGEARTVEEKTAAAGQLEGALSRLMLVVERYPELKSNQNFLALQDELAGTENRIAVERRRYNEVVRAYNTAIRRFPTNIVASLFGFASKPYFEAEEGASQAPQVEF